MKRVLFYAVVGGLLIALLKALEYKYFVRAYPGEIYGGLVAVIFSAVGIYLGLRWAHAREVVVIKEIRVPEGGPFELDAAKLKELGITQREHEILELVGEGLTNAQVAERLWISPGTVRKHLENAFAKLGVSTRTAAVAALSRSAH